MAWVNEGERVNKIGETNQGEADYETGIKRTKRGSLKQDETHEERNIKYKK